VTDRCYFIEVDGVQVRVRGDRRHATEADNSAIADIVRAARRLRPERIDGLRPTSSPLIQQIRDQQRGNQ